MVIRSTIVSAVAVFLLASACGGNVATSIGEPDTSGGVEQPAGVNVPQENVSGFPDGEQVALQRFRR